MRSEDLANHLAVLYCWNWATVSRCFTTFGERATLDLWFMYQMQTDKRYSGDDIFWMCFQFSFSSHCGLFSCHLWQEALMFTPNNLWKATKSYTKIRWRKGKQDIRKEIPSARLNATLLIFLETIVKKKICVLRAWFLSLNRVEQA